MIVMGPAEHIPELRPILLNWRRDAKLLLESDLPSADQILADRRCVPDPSDQAADQRFGSAGDRRGMAAGAAIRVSAHAAFMCPNGAHSHDGRRHKS